jgi:hypothetical protein
VSVPSEVEARENLMARGKFDPVMDLAEAHLGLRERGEPIDIANRTSFTTRVWIWMGRFALAHTRTSEDWRDREAAKQYVREKLGARTARLS